MVILKGKGGGRGIQWELYGRNYSTTFIRVLNRVQWNMLNGRVP
jgi:hypothetical protein